MFGSNRRKATKAAIESIRPLLAVWHYREKGLPSLFWRDPYALGFVGFTASHFARLATRGKVKGEKLFHSVSDAITQVSNLNGHHVFSEYCDYAQEFPKNEPFERACDNAALIIFYQHDILKDEDSNFHIMQAKESIRSSSLGDNDPSNERDQITSYLMTKLYVNEIELRISE